MKRFYLLMLILPLLSSAQRKFTINKGSKNYTAVISIDSCDTDHCEGLGIVQLFDKKTKKKIQNIISEGMSFYFDLNQKPTVNVIELYGEQSPLIFDDFNFDGSEDVAVRDGNDGGYGGPSYDVYVYNITRKKFVLSKELTKLASENLGMFGTDQKTKRISTFTKSGCCWHKTTEYTVVPKKGLVAVYEMIEDATVGDESVLVTEKKLVNKKWVVKKKKYKVDDYYKD